MAHSSDVAAGQTATAAQYNNLRKDSIDATDGHTHTGATGTGPSLFKTIVPSGTYSLGTNYLALVDLFVMVVGTITSGSIVIEGYTDSSATPTTLVLGNSASGSAKCGFTMVVKRGNYFRVAATGSYSGGAVISTQQMGA